MSIQPGQRAPLGGPPTRKLPLDGFGKRLVMTVWVAVLLTLAGCGDLPQPFLGRPGAAASRLAVPPPSRLSVFASGSSLMPDASARDWAAAVTEALVGQEVPAVTRTSARRGEWSLMLSAEIRDGAVMPAYDVRDANGVSQGISEGAPVPPASWASGTRDVLHAAAAQAAPGIASLLSRIEAAQRQSDPNSLQNRPARIYFVGVTGAPGDGNQSLPRQMRLKLATLGLVVQDDAKNADFSLAGEVATAPGDGGTLRIELQWIVKDGTGERGRIIQLNEVPPKSLNQYWGDVAVVVADEAAGGVRDVIANSGGAKRKQ